MKPRTLKERAAWDLSTKFRGKHLRRTDENQILMVFGFGTELLDWKQMLMNVGDFPNWKSMLVPNFDDSNMLRGKMTSNDDG